MDQLTDRFQWFNREDGKFLWEWVRDEGVRVLSWYDSLTMIHPGQHYLNMPPPFTAWTVQGAGSEDGYIATSRILDEDEQAAMIEHVSQLNPPDLKATLVLMNRWLEEHDAN